MSDHSPMKDFWSAFSRNKGALIGLSIVCFFVFLALFAPLIAPFSPIEINSDSFLKPPFWLSEGSSQFPLGTDDLGRDLLSRLIYGSQVSMGIGFLVVIFALTVGVSLGLLAGFRGGWVDSLIMRGVDILMSLPSVLLAIVIVSIFTPSTLITVIAVSVVAIPAFVRLVRASVLAEKEKQYVLASQSFGAQGFRQAVVNILPNCMAPIIVQASLGFSDAILNAAALGFLGLGAQPPTPEWGTMLSDSRNFIESQSWLVTLPGLCILLVVLGFNLLGDGLRDALDPKLKR